jgi:hypothetical protein
MTSTDNLSPSLRRGSSNMSSRRPSHGADGPSGIMSTADANMPMRHPRPLTAAELHLELEKEQEAVVCSLIILHIPDDLTHARRSTVSHANSQHSVPNTLPRSPATLRKPAPTRLWIPVSHIQHPHVNTAHPRTPQTAVLARLRSPRVTSTSTTLNPPLLSPASRKPPSIAPPLPQAPLQQTLPSAATRPSAVPRATPHQLSPQPLRLLSLTALPYRKPPAKSPQPAHSPSVRFLPTHPHPASPKSPHRAPNSTWSSKKTKPYVNVSKPSNALFAAAEIASLPTQASTQTTHTLASKHPLPAQALVLGLQTWLV